MRKKKNTKGKKGRTFVYLLAYPLYMSAGFLSLLYPAFVLILMWNFFPAALEKIYIAYTDLDNHFFFNNAKITGKALEPYMYPYLRNLYSERFAVETIVRTYNVLIEGIALASFVTLLSLLLNYSLKKLAHIPFIGIISHALFILLACIAAYLMNTPLYLLFSALCFFTYIVNFRLDRFLDPLRPGSAEWYVLLILILCTPCLSHITAPVFIIGFFLLTLFPQSCMARYTAILAGRVLVCILSYPFLAICFLSYRQIPLSPKVQKIIDGKNLYDIEIDFSGKQMFVTTKDKGIGYALPLDMRAPPKFFRVPTGELEDIELDTDRREIYHLDRVSHNLIILDADTLKVKRIGKIDSPGSGTTLPALIKSLDRLFVTWENDNLVVINRNTFKTEALFPVGPDVADLADEKNKVVYLTYSNPKAIYALDAKKLEIVSSNKGPEMGERMTLVSDWDELYTPAVRESEVWVYSTPDLKLLRKIPTQYGVRAIAVDEKNRLLLAASVVTGFIDVIDLNNGKTVGHHYVGKYCRIMRVDPERRNAYITLTKEGLYRFSY